MTDNEIVKALEYCFDNTNVDCGKCVYNECDGNCVDGMIKDALDIINRQKAEIERLNKEVDRLSQLVLYHDGDVADAIKEFADRLKKLEGRRGVPVASIDNLVKEMVGE